MLAMGASWPITKHVKAYCILFLLLETGMLGVFMALDFFLFYVFWEVMLLPMYFLIGIWGGPRREYAAIKFFLFTLVGSVLMLVAMLMLYFNSDLHTFRAFAELAADRPDGRLAVPPDAVLGQVDRRGGRSCCCSSASLVKVPAVPFHTWLPDAHVEAPTPISMILAGVLLKMGGYGIIRICYPICPDAGYELAWLVCGLGVVSMVYGAFAAMAQKDFKRLVAYSSVSHMGYVVLGIGVWSDHGRQHVQHRLLEDGHERGHVPDDRPRHQLGWHVLPGRRGLRPRAPPQPGPVRRAVRQDAGLQRHWRWASSSPPWACPACADSSARCSSCSRSWNYSKALAVVAASVVILTAGYILWTIQRVYLGPEYKGPHAEALTPMTRREAGHRHPAGGPGDSVRRLSEGGVQLHDPERGADGGRDETGRVAQRLGCADRVMQTSDASRQCRT